MTEKFLPIREIDLHIMQCQHMSTSRYPQFLFRLLRCFCLRLHMVSKCAETIGAGLPGGDACIYIHQIGQRVLNFAKTVGNLHQTAQRNLFCKISGSRHHKWENNGNLPVPTGEPGHLLVFLYYQILISYRQKEPEKQSLVFPSASMIKGHTFCRIAEAHHTKSEICFPLLLFIVERNQFLPHLMSHPGTGHRV